MRQLIALMCIAGSLGAQQATATGVRRPETADSALSAPRQVHHHSHAFLRETGFALAAAQIGWIPLLVHGKCFGNESDERALECGGDLVVAAGIVAPIASAFAVRAAGRHHGVPHNYLGAWLGALAGGVVGVAAGSGLWEMGAPDAVVVLTAASTYSVLSALGSRALAASRAAATGARAR